MNILGFDQASFITGFAYAENEGVVDFGTISVSKKMDLLERISVTKQNVGTLIEKYNPDIILLEDTQLQRNPLTFKALSKLLGILEMYVIEQNIPCVVIPCNEWREGLGIKGKNREQKKQNAIRYVKEVLGLELTDDNMAEAICIVEYYRQKYSTKSN